MHSNSGTLKILGIDPSFRNWGMALMSYTPFSLELDGVTIIQTNKGNIRTSDDDLNRVTMLYEGLQLALKEADVVVAEIPLGSQNAHSMKSYGIVLGLLGTIPDLIRVSPYDVKAVIGKNASKKKIIEWVEHNHPDVLHKNLGIAEHQADAVLTIYAGLPQIRNYYENHFKQRRT